MGSLVISLDFELAWGREWSTLAGYRENLLGVRQAIPAMLALFERYEVRATWATVGMLMFDSKQALLQALPEHQPQYGRASLSNYDRLERIGDDEAGDPLHFGLSLVDAISRTRGQELGSHTFSHYYCLEPGQSALEFRADLKAARRRAERLGVELKSFVFPRNQFNEDYLSICASEGLTCFRGNESSWLYKPVSKSENHPMRRLARLADAHVNLTGHHLATPSIVETRPRMVNIPASRFLRPAGGPGQRLRLARVIGSLEAAAKRDQIFHLWWHPHNFGRYLGENLAGLQAILARFAALRQTYDFESLTMSQAAMSAAP